MYLTICYKDRKIIENKFLTATDLLSLIYAVWSTIHRFFMDVS